MISRAFDTVHKECKGSMPGLSRILVAHDLCSSLFSPSSIVYTSKRVAQQIDNNYVIIKTVS